MPIYKAVCQTWLDTLEPKDGMQITPHFDDKGLGTNPDGLATDLLAAYKAYTQYSGTTQHRVSIYDVHGTEPNYPKAVKTANAGAVVPSATNRDIAVCLSFFGGENRPRKRGRLYLALCVIGGSATGPNVSSTTMTKVAGLVPILSGLGGADVDWVVYSRVANSAVKVSDYWVDDAWDTQRRRGVRAKTRNTGTTSG